jgi:hypothetical protein
MASTTTKKKTLVEALAAFQADLPEIGLDKENPHFRSKFASLANISKIVLPKLAEHGFAFSVGSFVDNGVLIVDAHLIYEDGTSRSAQFPVTETNPQKVGSAVTYYRRYALAALTGIVADEDDDGNAASAPAPKAVQQALGRKPVARPAENAGSARDKIRTEWIDTGKSDRDAVNRLTEAVKSEENLSGNALYEAVLKRLENGETA